MSVTLGIDPGWASFGIAVCKDGQLKGKTSFIPKNYGTIIGFLTEMNAWLVPLAGEKYEAVYLERFVTYSGVQADGENVLMLIGALDYMFSMKGTKPKLVRALDWKVKLCQHIVRTEGVSNPNSKLDKKFSMWAAEMLSSEKFKSDHEADAVCLSYLNDSIIKVK